MKNILILCTGNSCRSQIAEGYFRLFAGGQANIFSAGVETHGLNPNAVRTMAEDGIDISSHTSNHVDEYAHIPFDFVITVCDHAQERCPVFPSKAIKIHRNFTDPTKFKGNEEDTEQAFRNAREEIKGFAKRFIEDNL